MFHSEKDKANWEENAKALIDLLDEDNNDEKIMVAELYRNLGEFQKCHDILESVDNPDLEWLKESFKKEIKNRNKNVFQLN